LGGKKKNSLGGKNFLTENFKKKIRGKKFWKKIGGNFFGKKLWEIFLENFREGRGRGRGGEGREGGEGGGGEGKGGEGGEGRGGEGGEGAGRIRNSSILGTGEKPFLSGPASYYHKLEVVREHS